MRPLWQGIAAFAVGCGICGGFFYLLPTRPGTATAVLALYVPIMLIGVLVKSRKQQKNLSVC